jgi:hypothetical protein
MMGLPTDSFVIKVCATLTDCVLLRRLSAPRYNLTLPLWAALAMLWLSW